MRNIRAGDFLSALQGPEISVTGASTALVGRMHVCSGTSADYQLTLPSPASFAGECIGVRMSNALTKLVTLAESGSPTTGPDGAARIMWAGESAVLLSDGASWCKVAGKVKPFICFMIRDTTLVLASGSAAEVPVNESFTDNSGLMADVANTRINIRRSGQYTAQTRICADNNSITGLRGDIYKNGVFLASGTTISAGIFQDATSLVFPITLVAGDYLELYGLHFTGSDRTLYGAPADPATGIRCIEVPSW